MVFHCRWPLVFVHLICNFSKLKAWVSTADGLRHFVSIKSGTFLSQKHGFPPQVASGVLFSLNFALVLIRSMGFHCRWPPAAFFHQILHMFLIRSPYSVTRWPPAAFLSLKLRPSGGSLEARVALGCPWGNLGLGGAFCIVKIDEFSKSGNFV